MCTVSWTGRDSRFTVLFNRDESRKRAPALPPTENPEGEQYIAPTDTAAGGTWIAANRFGLVVCLLNRYGEVVQPQGEPVSRGQLVRSLADVSRLDLLEKRIRRPDKYQPFTLVAFQPDADAAVFDWDGRDLATARHSSPGLVRTSSAVDFPEARESRARLFQQALQSESRHLPEALELVHRSHVPDKGKLSVCMHRSDARSVSFTRVDVSNSRVTMRYENDSPCQRHEPRITHLTRIE